MGQFLRATLRTLQDIYTYRYFNYQHKAPRYRGVYASFAAAEAALRGARTHPENAFKVELAKRCVVRALKMATA